MLFDDAQSYTAFKSSCRLSQSVTSPTPEYTGVKFHYGNHGKCRAFSAFDVMPSKFGFLMTAFP